MGWLGASIALAFVAAGCEHSEPPPLRIGLSVWPPYEMPFLARDLGYFEDTSFHLVNIRTPDGVMRAYRNGMIDAVAVTAEYAVEFAALGGDDRVVLVIDVSNGADALIARPEIADLAGLRGKRIGVGLQALGLHVLRRALDAGGLSLDDVTIVPMDLAGQPDAFARDLVDAVVTYEPTRTNLLDGGARQLFSSAQMPGEIVDVLVMRQTVIDQRPREVQALVDGWLRAVNRYRADPAGAARRMAPREGMTPDAVIDAFHGIMLLDREANQRMLGGRQPTLVPTLERLAQTMVEFRLLDHAPPVDDLVTDALVRGP